MQADQIPDIRVEISDMQGHVRLDPEELIHWVQGVLQSEGIQRASVTVAIVDDAAIRDLNRRYLGHDWPTDVLAFPLSEPGDPELAGELVLSAEMAAATARQAGVPARNELALYLVHGLLHLCGHDDQDPASVAAMRRREEETFSALGLANPFAALASSPHPAAEDQPCSA